MTAIAFLDLDTATLQGATRRLITIGTVSNAEMARIYDPATYAGQLKDGRFIRQLDYWHDGEQFVGDDRPLADKDFVHPGQWRALLSHEACHYSMFDYGDRITITEAFHARVGDADPLAPIFHRDIESAPGQRMYFVGSRIAPLNVEYPAGDMRYQDLPATIQQRMRHLHHCGDKNALEQFQTDYFKAHGGMGQIGANGVAVAPQDGIHRSSLQRPAYSDEAWYFGRLGVTRAQP